MGMNRTTPKLQFSVSMSTFHTPLNFVLFPVIDVPFPMGALPRLSPLAHRSSTVTVATIIRSSLSSLLIHGIKQHSHPTSIHRHRRAVGLNYLRFHRLWSVGQHWTLVVGMAGCLRRFHGRLGMYVVVCWMGDWWVLVSAIMATLVMFSSSYRVDESRGQDGGGEGLGCLRSTNNMSEGAEFMNGCSMKTRQDNSVGDFRLFCALYLLTFRCWSMHMVASGRTKNLSPSISDSSSILRSSCRSFTGSSSITSSKW